jgi:hypothetical protein
MLGQGMVEGSMHVVVSRTRNRGGRWRWPPPYRGRACERAQPGHRGRARESSTWPPWAFLRPSIARGEGLAGSSVRWTGIKEKLEDNDKWIPLTVTQEQKQTILTPGPTCQASLAWKPNGSSMESLKSLRHACVNSTSSCTHVTQR